MSGEAREAPEPRGARGLESGAVRSPTIVLTYGWALGTPGGVARHLRELATHLAEQGARVIFVCVSAAGYSSFPRPRLEPDFLGTDLDPELARLGIEVVRVAPHPLHWMLDSLPVRRAVERIAAERRVDAVLGIYGEAASLPRLCAARGILFGYVATWQSYRMALARERQGGGLRGFLKHLANRRFVLSPYRRAGVLFANSRFTRDELVEVVGVAPERIRVTYLGIPEAFLEIPRAKPARIERLLFFGRFVREKGIGDAIEALGSLRDAGPWTLRAVGSGARDHVRRLAATHGIAERVEILDHLGHGGLQAELEAAHLAILPSYSESFGMAIAESQAAGLAVAAYRAGSVPEVVEDGVTARLAPLRDVGALAANLRAFLEDPETTHAMGLAGRERVRREFGWERTAAATLEGLRELGPAATAPPAP